MKKALSDYINPAEAVEDFEKALADFVNPDEKRKSVGVVCVDSVEHAIELGLRMTPPKMYATLPENVPVSTAMTLAALGIEYMITDDTWEKEYRIQGSVVYDSRDYFASDMYKLENPNQQKLLCISFKTGGAAIITNRKEAHDWLKLAANGGRDPVAPDEVTEYSLGWQYQMRPSDAIAGMAALADGKLEKNEDKKYPNLRNITINK